MGKSRHRIPILSYHDRKFSNNGNSHRLGYKINPTYIYIYTIWKLNRKRSGENRTIPAEDFQNFPNVRVGHEIKPAWETKKTKRRRSKKIGLQFYPTPWHLGSREIEERKTRGGKMQGDSWMARSNCWKRRARLDPLSFLENTYVRPR